MTKLLCNLKCNHRRAAEQFLIWRLDPNYHKRHITPRQRDLCDDNKRVKISQSGKIFATVFRELLELEFMQYIFFFWLDCAAIWESTWMLQAHIFSTLYFITYKMGKTHPWCCRSADAGETFLLAQHLCPPLPCLLCFQGPAYCLFCLRLFCSSLSF